MSKQKKDLKVEKLRKQGCLHPNPQKVRDKLFVSNDFFDARDLVQVKYEMLRRVRVDGKTISQSTADFGLSRPSFYHAKTAFEKGGLAALLPKKPGPKKPHKLTEEVINSLNADLENNPGLTSDDLVKLVEDRFGIIVHSRSIERALDRQEKKHQYPPREQE